MPRVLAPVVTILLVFPAIDGTYAGNIHCDVRLAPELVAGQRGDVRGALGPGPGLRRSERRPMGL